jgi:hypothetical protein
MAATSVRQMRNGRSAKSVTPCRVRPYKCHAWKDEWIIDEYLPGTPAAPAKLRGPDRRPTN